MINGMINLLYSYSKYTTIFIFIYSDRVNGENGRNQGYPRRNQRYL